MSALATPTTRASRFLVGPSGCCQNSPKTSGRMPSPSAPYDRCSAIERGTQRPRSIRVQHRHQAPLRRLFPKVLFLVEGEAERVTVTYYAPRCWRREVGG